MKKINKLHILSWNVNNKDCSNFVDSIVENKLSYSEDEPIIACLQEVPYSTFKKSNHCFFELMVGMHSDEPGGLRFPKFIHWGPAVILPKNAIFLSEYTPSYFNNALIRNIDGGTEIGIRSTKWITFKLNGCLYIIISVHCSNKENKRDLLIRSIFEDGKRFANSGLNVIIAGDFNTTPEQWKKYDLCGFDTDKMAFDTSDNRQITNINPDGTFYDRIDYIFTYFKNNYKLEKEDIKGIDNSDLPRTKRRMCTEMSSNGYDHAILIHSFSLCDTKN